MNNPNNNSESFIICLDDDKDFLNSLKISLPEKFQDVKGCNFLFMDNPLETLEMIRDIQEDSEAIALIMTPQMMPDMKGIDFLSETKKITPDSMRVLLTGYAGLDSTIVAINENVLHKYLTKPISDFEDLVFTLKGLLNEYNLNHTVDSQERVILDLYQFSNTLSTLDSLEEILEHTVSFTRDTLNCDRISILLLEDETLSIKACTGISEEIAKGIRIAVGQNVADGVLKNREAIHVENIDEINWMKNPINAEFKSFISAPVICANLKSYDIPLGVINVTNKNGNEPFSKQDLKILSFIANTASVAINNHQNRQMLEQSYFDTVTALIMSLEARDEYTKGHSDRVTEYSVGIARQLQLEEEMIKTIKDAAILHDIGKIGVRDDVLLKTGRLTPEEFSEIKKHPVISGSIAKSISSLQETGEIVSQHHERYDGRGYPDGLKDEEIHIGARIMAVADTYDAMTSNRSYRKALDPDYAVKEIKNEAGTQFDPRCVEAFLQYLSEEKTTEQ